MESSPSSDALFELGEAVPADGRPAKKPLAARMRPRSLDEVVGQEHLLGKDCLLPRLIAADNFGSLLLYGPPGCGKTTLAEVIAQVTHSRFVRVNAVLSNVAELREILRMARARPQDRTLLFIDEIHRFNKAQQDLLLPDVEAGNIRLIGATTQNPSFYIIPALLSRSHLFRLEPVSPQAVESVLARALADLERGLGATRVKVAEGVFADIAHICNGDLRRALNALETLVLSAPTAGEVSRADIEVFARERRIRYDRGEDEHYDTASAFIKSIRGGDPDAVLYWMAKMLEGDEDPRFIARRLVILASEDVGLADSRALPLAVAAFQACDLVGLPECALNLAHAAIFLATCPKSNSATEGIFAARKAVKENPVQAVPPWLRDSHQSTGKRLGHGADYRYSHEYLEAVSGQDYMLSPEQFYFPKTNGSEAAIAERLAHWKQMRRALQAVEKKAAKKGKGASHD